MVSCEKVINIKLAAGVAAGYIDLAQCLCKLNRSGKFRQGSQYVIESIRVNNFGDSSNVMSVFRMPDNWCVTNAHTKALAEWNEQQLGNAEDTSTESMVAKYRDFKIFMTEEHAGLGEAANLLPDGYGLTDVAAGAVYEWDYSEIVIPNVGGSGNTTEYKMHMLGDDIGTSKALVKAYAQSRTRPKSADPNIVTPGSGGLWAEVVDVGEDTGEITQNTSRRNNNPPYPLNDNTTEENYPGGEYVGTNISGHEEATALVGTGFRTVIPGFVVPCGLLKISFSASDAVRTVQIRMAPAPKGVLMQPMKVAN